MEHIRNCKLVPRDESVGFILYHSTFGAETTILHFLIYIFDRRNVHDVIIYCFSFYSLNCFSKNCTTVSRRMFVNAIDCSELCM
jgi:hypothetical protein